jgi:hypothetical protein
VVVGDRREFPYDQVTAGIFRDRRPTAPPGAPERPDERSTMKIGIALAFLWVAASAAVAQTAGDCVKDSYGNVVCGRGQCATDQYGKVLCAKAGGGAVRDRYGVVSCGVGMCATSDLGEVMCSTQPGGGAAMDSYGKVVCLGGCERASERRCEAAR